MTSIEEKQSQRFLFLKRLYELADGDRSGMIALDLLRAENEI